MKFRFKLETLLNHRRHLKDEAQRDYLEAQSEVNNVLQEIQHMFDKMDESRMLIAQSEKAGSGNQAAMFVSANEFLGGQKIKIERKRQQARELMIIAEQKHEALVQLSQDYEALKKLKEKKLIEHKKKLKKRDAKEMDDIVTMKFTGSGL